MAERLTVARPYAKAIFRLAQAQQRLPQWSAILQRAASVVSNEQVAPLLGNPHVSADQLVELIAGIAGAGAGAGAGDAGDTGVQARNLFATLAAYRRLSYLAEIALRFETLRSEAERTQDVTVTSAVALSEQQRAQYTAALVKRLGRTIRLHCEIDPALLGGAVVRADDLVIDGSVRASLTQLAAAAAS